MMKNSKLKFREYMQNISWSKRFGKFVLICNVCKKIPLYCCTPVQQNARRKPNGLDFLQCSVCELAQILGLNSSFEYASDDRQITAAGGLLCFFFAMSLKPLFSKATTMTNCD